jgi:uncharacterized protein YecE (DUF72 family)
VVVLIGSSGWSYDDWVGRFYPIEMAKKKGEWFAYYAQYFKTVEINSTFYRVPNEFMVKSWIKKASELEGFEYSLKLPKLITHESMVKGNHEAASNQAKSFERICIEPLAENGKMGCALIQLSPYFRSEGDSLKTLTELLESVSCDRFHYAVEFRHRSWFDKENKEIADEARSILQEHGVANVMIDGPGSPITRAQTADHSYIRFHGRNYDIWYKGEDEDDYRINRYDYLYSIDHLKRWVPIISEVGERTKNIRLYFNNHGRAKAVKNAIQMMDMLSIPHKEKEIRLQDQMKLGSYE